MASDSYSVQAGYTVGRGRVTSIFNSNWNRSDSSTTNYFTNGADIATQLGIDGPNGAALNANPLNYGVPSVTMSEFTGISETQPNSSIAQTISLSETLAWRAGKHNMRFGGDYRRVHRDFLGGSNATGTFYFTGAYTGSAFGDFPQGRAAGDFDCRGSGQELFARQRNRLVCAGRLAGAREPDVDVWNPLRVLRAVYGKIQPPGHGGYEPGWRIYQRGPSVCGAGERQFRHAAGLHRVPVPSRLLRRAAAWPGACPGRPWFAPGTA